MMKAISLYQPWASLVAIGEKKIETRSWKTDYRGPLAIHASKNRKHLSPWGNSLVIFGEPFKSVLENHFGRMPYPKGYDLPLGSIVATCYLRGVVKIPQRGTKEYTVFSKFSTFMGKPIIKPSEIICVPPYEEPELSFGDYTPGRYAWVLDNVKLLDQPVPARGRQRLWEWDDSGVEFQPQMNTDKHR